jgi:hypothetical protein
MKQKRWHGNVTYLLCAYVDFPHKEAT